MVMRTLVNLASLVVIVLAVRMASPVLAPLALAATLAIAFEPFAVWLQRRGLSRAVAAGLTSLAMLSIVAGLGGMLLRAAFQLADELPRYTEALRAQSGAVQRWLEHNGLAGVADRLRTGGVGDHAAALAERTASSVFSLLQASVLVLLTTVFMQLDAPSLRGALRARLRYLPPSSDANQSERAVDDGLSEIRHYVLVKGCISLAGGTLLGLWCWLWGVDGALVWGALAFLLNFVPIVGSLISAVPPVLLALVTGGPGTALGVAGGFLAVNLLVDNVLEPRVMGRAMGLSPLVVLIAMMVWGLVLGPIGALLSVPLTIAMRTLLVGGAGLTWVEALLSDDVSGVRMTLTQQMPAVEALPLPAVTNTAAATVPVTAQ
jgi:AI-2 transport protein TqsA